MLAVNEAKTEMNKKNKLILIVDDEAIIALSKKKTIEKYGYSVILAHSGEDAIKIVADEPRIDMVLMDIDLGRGIDGTQAAQLILDKHNIPVVFLSSHTEPEFVEKTGKITSYGFIVKNSGETVLIASIRTAFRLHSAKQKEQTEKIKAWKSEENLRITLQSVGDAVISTDTKGFVARMNPVAEELTGWKEKDAVGETLKSVLNIKNAVTGMPCENPVEKVMTNGEIVGLANHTTLVSKNGTEYQVADSASPIKNSNGNITGVVLVFRDVTEEYTVRRELEESRQKYYTLFHQSLEGIYIHDLAGRIVEVNMTACDQLGYTREQLLALNIFDLHPDVSDTPNLEMKQILNMWQNWKTGERHILDAIHKRSDGRILDVQISTGKIQYAGSDYIMALVCDVSAINTMQKELNSYFDMAIDLLCIADVNGRFLRVNKQWQALGYNPVELEGQKFMDYIHSGDMDAADTAIAKLKNQEDVIDFKARIKCKDGSYRLLEWRSHPRGTTIFSVARDISE